MWLKFLRAKLHLANVTQADLHYHGSLTIDRDLMDAVGLFSHEAILVSNTATGARAETYVLPGKRGTGVIALNGAMARLGAVGDQIIIMSFAFLQPDEAAHHVSRVAVLDRDNHVVERIVTPVFDADNDSNSDSDSRITSDVRS